MFFIGFVGYAGIFIYIMNNNPWLKRHGFYINLFSTQMCVIISKNLNINDIVRGLFYSYFGRMINTDLNTYMAFRTAPLILSILSMTSYTI